MIENYSMVKLKKVIEYLTKSFVPFQLLKKIKSFSKKIKAT